METKELTEQILQYLDGRLSPEEEQAVAAEIKGNPEAEQLLADMILMHGELSGALENHANSNEKALTSIMQLVKKRTPGSDAKALPCRKRWYQKKFLWSISAGAAVVLLAIGFLMPAISAVRRKASNSKTPKSLPVWSPPAAPSTRPDDDYYQRRIDADAKDRTIEIEDKETSRYRIRGNDPMAPKVVKQGRENNDVVADASPGPAHRMSAAEKARAMNQNNRPVGYNLAVYKGPDGKDRYWGWSPVAGDTDAKTMSHYLKDSEKVRKMHQTYAKNYLEIARKQYEKYRLEEAKENLKLALRYDPELEKGAVLLEKVQGLLGERPSKVQTFYDWALREQKVMIQQPDWNTEAYDVISENIFLDVLNNPLSTFSIDVDTASYANMRRHINGNKMPPKDSVRIEELINYFSYDYPQPEEDHPFSINTEISDCPWNDAHWLVHVGLKGLELQRENTPPSNLVFLLDVSGSMNSPQKLPLVKRAFRLLVENLRSEDRVAIVVYAGSEGLALPSTAGDEKKMILAAIDNLRPGGSTAGAAGIQLAYRVARQNFIKEGNNRVILATDGDFNVGVSSDAQLVEIIEEKRKQGVFLTVLGFGTGNYKDAKMEKLADKGNGNYAYIDSLMEAKKVFVNELTGTLFTIAKDVKIQIEFNPAKIKGYRLIGYENRILNKEDFNDDKKDAGELGAGHTVTALYEIIPAGSTEKVSDVDPLKYQTNANAPASKSEEIMNVKFRYKKPDGDKSILIVKPVTDRSETLSRTSDNFRWSAAVAGFGMVIRESQYKGDFDYDKVVKLARAARGKDLHGYRAEFIKLVEMVELLQK